MDPNACLERLLDACKEWNACPRGSVKEKIETLRDAREEALEALADLSRWIRSGGFLPCDLRRERERKATT